MEDRLGKLDKCREVGKWLEVGKIHPMVHMDRAETIDDYNRDDDT